MLMPYSGGQPLHVSELELPDHPGSKEVCRIAKNLPFKYILPLRHDLIICKKNRQRERSETINKTEFFSFSAAVLLIFTRY